MSHTPGPWKWVLQSNGWYALEGEPEAGKYPPTVLDDGSSAGEYSPAIAIDSPDARLIAASPELLEELRQSQSLLVQMRAALYFSGIREYDDRLITRTDANRAVIAKATGQDIS